MRATGQILLLATYELGHQPLALALPLAFLHRAGFSPIAVDTSVESLEDATIEAARLVVISIPMHTATRLGVQLAERIRTLNPQAHIVFCGLYAHLNAALLVPARGDSVLAGEYEQALVELAERLEGEVVSADAPTIRHLARLPFLSPERESLPALSNYAHFRIGDDYTVPAGYVEATRGCLHTCLHCPITPVYEGRFFAVPREVVLQDIRAQVAAGAQHITFGDPDFLNGPRHSLTILRAMHAEFPDLTFDATIKVEHILEHRDIFTELKSLGCAFVVSAVESFSERVLEELAKGHTAEDIGTAMFITREADIALRPTFVAFTPWTTPQDFIEMLNHVEAYGMVEQVDPVQFTIRLLIPPQSALLNEQNRAEGWLGELDPEAFTYRWTHPDPRMDALHREVAALVEQGVAMGDSAGAIFEAIRQVAYAHAGVPMPMQRVVPLLPALAVVPSLTESWFCCAEPTAAQMDSLLKAQSCCSTSKNTTSCCS